MLTTSLYKTQKKNKHLLLKIYSKNKIKNSIKTPFLNKPLIFLLT